MAIFRRPPKAPRDPRLIALPDNFLACRMNRHDLSDLPDHVQRWRYPECYVIEMRRDCARCGSVQVSWVQEHDGELYRPTGYIYSQGYLVKNPEGVEGPTPRSASRLEWVRRFLDRNPLPATTVE